MTKFPPKIANLRIIEELLFSKVDIPVQIKILLTSVSVFQLLKPTSEGRDTLLHKFPVSVFPLMKH